ncbi:MAG: DUF1292 domain-containing protein [Clostridiales bacterium]|nr:DUF1292 domain-containing protein [Clostridiales bacterium]
MDNELNNCCGHNHGEECGCGHEHNHDHSECDCGCESESFVIDLEDENGNVVSCPIIDAFEFEDSEYVLAQNPEDGSVYMFKNVNEELIVPEEEEFNRVATYYNDELVEEE